jgi:cell division protein FtsW
MTAMMIEINVNMGALPTKGLTLPFVSYSGSSMIVCCLAADLLLRVGREQGRTKAGSV